MDFDFSCWQVRPKNSIDRERFIIGCYEYGYGAGLSMAKYTYIQKRLEFYKNSIAEYPYFAFPITQEGSITKKVQVVSKEYADLRSDRYIEISVDDALQYMKNHPLTEDKGE